MIQSQARVLYLEGIFVIESPIKSKQKYFISIIKRLLMFYPIFTDFVFNFIFEIMLRNHVYRLEQRTLVSLLNTVTKSAETHIRRLRRCPFYNCLQNTF